MYKRAKHLLIAASALLALADISHAASWARPELLLTPDAVEKNAGKANWVVVNCRDLKDYAKGHVPGAISLGKACKSALRDSTARAFKDAKKYESIFGKSGIGNDTHVVFYGEHKVTDTFKDVTVAFWILEYLGHDKAYVLNGGMDAWLKAGKKLTSEPSMKPEKQFKAKVVASRIASNEEMLQIAEGKKKGITVIDARTKAEHEGTDIRALRGGHVPNTTVNISHKDTMDQEKDPKTGKDVDNGYLSPDRVAGFYSSFDKNKRTIAYCQTGTRSTLTYLELRLLGFKDPANWDESWVVWGSNVKYPVANEQWLNFEKLKSLEADVKKLKDSTPKKDEAK